MIAAHEDRDRASACDRKGMLAEHADPALHLVIIFGVGWRGAVGDDIRPRQIAVVLDGEFELFEQAGNAGGPQRRRPHQRAGLRRADLDGHA
jgi:hypothetical protein